MWNMVLLWKGDTSMFLIIALQTLAFFAVAAVCSPRVFVPSITSAPQPFPWLNGGSFTGPEIPFHPDPLATYKWLPDVNASQLQVQHAALRAENR